MLHGWFCTGRPKTSKSTCPDDLESLLCVSSRNESRAARIRRSRRAILMLMNKERRTTIRTL